MHHQYFRMTSKLRKIGKLTLQKLSDTIWYKVIHGPTHAISVAGYPTDITFDDVFLHWKRLMSHIVTVELEYSKEAASYTGRVNVELRSPEEAANACVFNGCEWNGQSDSRTCLMGVAYLMLTKPHNFQIRFYLTSSPWPNTVLDHASR